MIRGYDETELRGRQFRKSILQHVQYQSVLSRSPPPLTHIAWTQQCYEQVRFTASGGFTRVLLQHSHPRESEAGQQAKLVNNSFGFTWMRMVPRSGFTLTALDFRIASGNMLGKQQKPIQNTCLRASATAERISSHRRRGDSARDERGCSIATGPALGCSRAAYSIQWDRRTWALLRMCFCSGAVPRTVGTG